MSIINIFIWLWIFLILIIIFEPIQQKFSSKEGFTPKIRSFYYPYVRSFRIYKESFLNEYNDNYFIKKLKNMGIY
jgi:hypothetical protein